MAYDGLVIVYNREIYNYLEIRQELEQQGYKFDTFWVAKGLTSTWLAIHRHMIGLLVGRLEEHSGWVH